MPDVSEPIFIHSLFRSGSTYLASVFRRLENDFWCYQEPANEILIRLNDDPDKLLEIGRETADQLRHPDQARPYFREFYELRDQLAGRFRKSFSYDEFFANSATGISEEFRSYVEALIRSAPARPVLQFCRSAGRCAALKEAFGGSHIHLWREPRNQWWSFQITDYFDGALACIYNAENLPPALATIGAQSGFVPFRAHDTGFELAHARKHPRGPENGYRAFYALWLYAYTAAEQCADLTVSIDELSANESYRSEIADRVRASTGARIDFSDCLISRNTFAARDERFFSDVERSVIDVFEQDGCDRSLLESIHEAHVRAYLLAPSFNESRRGAERAYEVARRLLRLHHESSATAAKHNAWMEECLARAQENLDATTAEVQTYRSQEHQLQAELISARERLESVRAVSVARAAEKDAELAVAVERSAQIEAELGTAQRDLEELRQRLADRDMELRFVERDREAERIQREAVEAELQQAHDQIADLNQHAHRWYLTAEEHRNELEALYASRSWRITRPVRAAKESGVGMVAAAIRFAWARPPLRRIGLGLTRQFPGLKSRLLRVAESRGLIEVFSRAPAVGPRGAQSDALTEDARRVYAALNTAREVQRRKPSG